MGKKNKTIDPGMLLFLIVGILAVFLVIPVTEVIDEPGRVGLVTGPAVFTQIIVAILGLAVAVVTAMLLWTLLILLRSLMGPRPFPTSDNDWKRILTKEMWMDLGMVVGSVLLVVIGIVSDEGEPFLMGAALGLTAVGHVLWGLVYSLVPGSKPRFFKVTWAELFTTGSSPGRIDALKHNALELLMLVVITGVLGGLTAYAGSERRLVVDTEAKEVRDETTLVHTDLRLSQERFDPATVDKVKAKKGRVIVELSGGRELSMSIGEERAEPAAKQMAAAIKDARR